MSKKYNRIVDVLSGCFFNMGKVARLAENLEKDHKTRIVCAEIALVAENGEVVYVMWSTEKTKKLLPNLINSLRKAGLVPYDDFIDKLSKSLPFEFCVKIENNVQAREIEQ